MTTARLPLYCIVVLRIISVDERRQWQQPTICIIYDYEPLAVGTLRYNVYELRPTPYSPSLRPRPCHHIVVNGFHIR